METNAEIEIPEPIGECTQCYNEVECCDECCRDFEDGDDVLCYRGKHRCKECAENIKSRKKKLKNGRKTN